MVLRMYKLSDEKWRASVCNSDTKSEEEASRNEHPEVYRDTLEDDTEDHDHATDDNSPPATEDVGSVRNDRKSAERANGHDASEQTEQRAFRVVEV